ncbi:MAG TPA: hypothetical protein ENH99_01510 [Candidatus Pacearchaeota archaeon]|nr:hypothetical protein [Candidatus Pacearchaeota archaeon]
MREIKFRAWDKHNKRMLEWMYPVDCWMRWLNGEDNEVEIMQFTGLLDKNGKEIYDGDIVITTRDIESGGNHKKPKLVHWQPHTCGFNIRNTYINKNGYYYEIIGNIFENKDLLSNK